MIALMEKILSPLSFVNARMIKILGWITVLILAFLTANVMLGVITRYVFGSQAGFTDELARMLLIWISFFGGALGFGKKAHIGLTLLTEKMEPQSRRVCEITAILISLIFIAGVWVVGGIMFLQTSIGSANKLATMPLMWWHVYICIPISGVFSAFFLTQHMLERIISKGDA